MQSITFNPQSITNFPQGSETAITPYRGASEAQFDPIVTLLVQQQFLMLGMIAQMQKAQIDRDPALDRQSSDTKTVADSEEAKPAVSVWTTYQVALRSTFLLLAAGGMAYVDRINMKVGLSGHVQSLILCVDEVT